MRARTRGARCARTGCARRARGCARCACTWGMAEQGGCTGRVHMRAQEGCARTGPQGRDVHEVADAVTNAYENLARQSKTPCSWWLKGDPVQGSLRWGRMRYGRRIRRTLAQPVRTCLAAVMLQRPFVQVPHIFAALCAEKSCPPSPDGVGDGAWIGWRMPAFLFVIRGPGGDILDVDGRGGMCHFRISGRFCSQKCPCHMVSGVHYR